MPLIKHFQNSPKSFLGHREILCEILLKAISWVKPSSFDKMRCYISRIYFQQLRNTFGRTLVFIAIEMRPIFYFNNIFNVRKYQFNRLCCFRSDKSIKLQVDFTEIFFSLGTLIIRNWKFIVKIFFFHNIFKDIENMFVNLRKFRIGVEN